jgi:DNA polymerase II small subunit
MTQNILKIFVEKGFLLDNEMLNFFEELSDEQVADEIINKIAIVSKRKLITKDLVKENFDKIKPVFFNLNNEKKKIIEKYFVNISISVEVKKEMSFEDVKQPNSKNSEHINLVKVLSSPVLQAQKLEVKDFIKHFRNRFIFLKNILQKNADLENLTSIDKLGPNNRNVSIIGIVTEKQITKNKNLILKVEDLTGSTKLLINQSKEEIFEKGKEILLDDVIGFKCAGSRDFLYVNDLFYPDSFLKEKHKTDEEIYAIFLSDLHIGSYNFLEKNLIKFIDWLNGSGCDKKQKETLKKIRYMFVVGDTIDGVGIYPGQEKDLLIGDIKEQYKKLAEFYRRIPSHISIIQCAGQHDAVRVAEPQPPVGDDFASPLHELENIHLVSNPSLVEVAGTEEKEGIKVLMYHGASMHGVINEIEELRLADAHKTPARVVKHLLLRRHLAPSHGATIYIPNENEDPLLIKEVPDIITTGDLHRTDIDKYNDVLIICNSCWQSITAFEEKVGNQPDPCKVPILNLKTREIKILDFTDDEDEEGLDNKEIKKEVIENVA